MSAHTPGPWQIKQRNLVASSAGRLLADCGFAEVPGDECQANARLISSAPDLLAALKKIAGGFINSNFAMSNPPDWYKAFGQLQNIARAAIAKAEGAP